jgi:histone deacetylase complex regulatory component SIN3
VIQRVLTLFNGHPALIQGFNEFLPPGYHIECGIDDNPDEIRVTMPSGANTPTIQRSPRPSLEAAGDLDPSDGLDPYLSMPSIIFSETFQKARQTGAQ